MEHQPQTLSVGLLVFKKKLPSQCLLAFFTVNKDELFFFSQGYKYNVAVYSFQQGILQHMVHIQICSCASLKTGAPK